MPSLSHETLLLLFRNRPELAPELMREVLGVELPAYAEARIESAELTDVQPAEYRADLVVLLYDGKPVWGIVVEVQLGIDERKHYAWPMYAAGLRARMRCPVGVLVISAHESVARWARAPIDLGCGNFFKPLALGPSAVPVVTDVRRAAADPELAVLSALAHGHSSDSDKAVEIAVAAMTASLGLDPDRSVLYFDLIYSSLGEAARQSLQAMDPAKYEFQSEFAKRYLSQGRVEGEAKGRAEGRAEGEAKGRAEGECAGAARVLAKLLTLKFGPLTAANEERLRSASAQDIERWTERVLNAATLDDVLF